jgi:hypothetical protein
VKLVPALRVGHGGLAGTGAPSITVANCNARDKSISCVYASDRTDACPMLSRLPHPCAEPGRHRHGLAAAIKRKPRRSGASLMLARNLPRSGADNSQRSERGRRGLAPKKNPAAAGQSQKERRHSDMRILPRRSGARLRRRAGAQVPPKSRGTAARVRFHHPDDLGNDATAPVHRARGFLISKGRRRVPGVSATLPPSGERLKRSQAPAPQRRADETKDGNAALTDENASVINAASQFKHLSPRLVTVDG